MSPFEQDILTMLSRVVKRDIVPTLITANRVIGQDEESPAAQAWHDGGFNAERGERDIHFTSASIRMVDVARFVRLLRSAGVDAAPALVEVLLARGIARNDIYLELLGPAARMIGDMWQDDECSFADVTMVVGRLHNILNSLRGERVVALSSFDSATILLSPAPGEQHTFGIAVVDAVFQDAGWQTSLSYTNDADDLIEQVSRRRFDAIGLSLSSASLSDVLRATIMRLRAASANPDMVVLVGGPAFEAAPQLAAYAGADAMVGKGVAAAARARELLPRHLSLSV
jgi:methanogenic corrinoid protein MtbC1